MNKISAEEEKIIFDKISRAILKNQEKMTDEQKYAVNFNENKNILISAAAGSGKTFVLVQRILKLIAIDNKDIRKILIATFTNAAAAQMSKKIYDALNNLIYEENINSKHLKDQLSYLSGADIGTLHSFCIKILKSYFYVTDAPCDFSIIDGDEDILLREEALSEVLSKLYEEGDDKFISLSDTYITAKGIDNLKQIILQSYDYAQSRPEGLNWLKDEIEYYKACTDLENSKWTKQIYSQYNEILNNAIELQETAINLAFGVIDDKSINQLTEEKDKIESLLAALETGDNIMDICSAFEFAALRMPPRYNGPLKDNIKNMRDNAKALSQKTANSIKLYSFDKARKENEKLYIVLSSLYDVIEKFDECYKEKKTKRKVITFNDCEHICLEILKNKDINREIKESYDYVYIDEYQDISMLQEEILKLISKEDNMFMVGDIKQSIYRFRLAEPDIFNSKFELYKKEKQKNELIILNKNFRSGKYVIDAVNAVFGSIMSKESADIEYDDDAKLAYNENKENAGAKTEIYIFTKPEKKSDDTNEESDMTPEEDDLEEYENAELEAVNTVEIIKNLLKNKIFDKEINAYRNAEYRDIAILLSSANVDGPHYADVFTQNNIPVFFDTNKNFFDNLEVCIIINLLSLIDNDYDDIALISVMRAPFFDFSIKEMFNIRKECNTGFYYEAIKHYIDNKNDNLSSKLRAFNNFINKYRALSRHIGIYDLIEKIYDDTGYYEYVALLEQGSSRKDNLTKLLDIAQKYEKSGACGLFGFINYLNKIRANQTDNFSLTSADKKTNCVKIMSIHKSKGLEFPIVIVGRTAKEFNKADLQKEIIFHKELGIGATFYDINLGYKCDSLAKIAIKGAVEDEITAEQMRLLYVAMTRAEERLIITCVKSAKEIESKKNKWNKAILSNQIKSFNTYLDWLMYAIMEDDFTWNKDIFDIHFTQCKNETINKEKKLAKKDIYKLLSSEDNELLDEKIYNKLKWIYDYNDEINLPQKLSVTQIKNKKSIKKYMSFENADENNFALRKGQITHYIMQTLNLEEMKKGDYEVYINNFLEELEYKNVINKKEKECVNVNSISNFFKSEIGIMILNAESVKREVEFYYIENANKIQDNIYSDDKKIYVQGVIDCVINIGGEIYIIDYKTDTYYNKISKDEKIQEYSIQIKMYKDAYEKIMNVQNVKCILSFINMGDNILINNK